MSEFILTDNINFDIKGVSLALGFFDGVHIAHKKVLQSAIDSSKKFGTKSVVLTFKNHPSEIISNNEYEFLTTPQERIEIFKKMGFDVVIMADFTTEIAQMTAADYFNNVILKFAPKSVNIGYNHKFGANRTGDARFLEEKVKLTDIELNILPRFAISDNHRVSSTFIKSLVKSGDVQTASELLVKPFAIKNEVLHGMQRGRKIGFPTLNLGFQAGKIIPKYGVYAGYTIIDGIKHPSIANVGIRPTFEDIKKPLAEINVINFNKNLYGKTVEFLFLKMLREEVKFSSVDALCRQISADKNIALEFLK